MAVRRDLVPCVSDVYFAAQFPHCAVFAVNKEAGSMPFCNASRDSFSPTSYFPVSLPVRASLTAALQRITSGVQVR
jgi:hypothetical protein